MGPRIHAHRDDADRKRALAHRLRLGDGREESLGGDHVVGRRRQRHEHLVGFARGLPQLLAVQSCRRVDDPPLQVQHLRVLAARFGTERGDRGKQRGPTPKPSARRLLRIAVVDGDALALAREPAGHVGGERSLAAPALGIRDDDGLQDAASSLDARRAPDESVSRHPPRREPRPDARPQRLTGPLLVPEPGPGDGTGTSPPAWHVDCKLTRNPLPSDVRASRSRHPLRANRCRRCRTRRAASRPRDRPASPPVAPRPPGTARRTPGPARRLAGTSRAGPRAPGRTRTGRAARASFAHRSASRRPASGRPAAHGGWRCPAGRFRVRRGDSATMDASAARARRIDRIDRSGIASRRGQARASRARAAPGVPYPGRHRGGSLVACCTRVFARGIPALSNVVPASRSGRRGRRRCRGPGRGVDPGPESHRAARDPSCSRCRRPGASSRAFPRFGRSPR